MRRLMDKLLLLHNALVINYRDIATSTARSIGLESVMYLHLYTVLTLMWTASSLGLSLGIQEACALE